MPLKRHEDGLLEWTDSICFLQHHGQAECDGVMVLKDVTWKGTCFMHKDPYLVKIWVCDKCGFVFEE